MRRIRSSLMAAILSMVTLVLVAVPQAFAALQLSCSPWTWAYFWSPRAQWWDWQYVRWCYDPAWGWFQQWGSWGWW
jgi:hypothetical protein